MGATKRLAELLVLAFSERHSQTDWYVVRFRNVLGSAGSVVPIFQQQIKDGQPLTVTHEEVTRYFMTIPEAVQLVLQSSLLEEARGNIAMLEMGEPVKIFELAKSMIRLSGRTEGVDATIEITGMRPGEKLHEELVAPEEEPRPSPVKKVMILSQSDIIPVLAEVDEQLRTLWGAVHKMDDVDLRNWHFQVPGVVPMGCIDKVGAGDL